MANFPNSDLPPNHDASPRCRNCGAIADASFCPKCGQAVKDRNRSIWSFARDFFSNLLATDSPAIRTLVLLFFRPGVLTQQNLRGRWQSYVPPFRLYLFLSLLSFFALFGPFSNIDALKENLNLETSSDGPNLIFAEPSAKSDSPEEQQGSSEVPQVSTEEQQDPPANESKVESEETESGAEDDVTWRSNLADFFEEENERFKEMTPQQQIEFFLEQFISAFPTFLVLFIPLFALGMKILYLGSGRYLFEHLLFSTHLISVSLTVIAAGYLIPLPWLTKTLFLLYLPMYLILALRRVYGSGVWGILFRFPIILILQFFISLFLIVIVSIYAILQA